MLAPEDWNVISNSEKSNLSTAVQSNSIEEEYTNILEKYDIAQDSPVVTSFGETKFKAHEFNRTKIISTYLFAFAAGPFDCLEQSEEHEREEPTINMRLFWIGLVFRV